MSADALQQLLDTARAERDQARRERDALRELLRRCWSAAKPKYLDVDVTAAIECVLRQP